MTKKNQISFFIIIAMMIGIGVSFLLTQNHADVSDKTSPNSNSIAANQLWVKAHSPKIGSKNAPVTLVEFIDPACEACRAMYPYIKQIMADYPNELRLVIRYVNFHAQSEQAIRILEATRKQGQFNTALEVLLAFQPAWAPHGREGSDPWIFIEKIEDLDIEQAKADAKSAEISKIIELDMVDVEAAEVVKTPSFFVNGKPLKLMHPDPLIEMIEEELKTLKNGS